MSGKHHILDITILSIVCLADIVIYLCVSRIFRRMDSSGNAKSNGKVESHSERFFKKPSNLHRVYLVSDPVCLGESLVKAFWKQNERETPDPGYSHSLELMRGWCRDCSIGFDDIPANEKATFPGMARICIYLSIYWFIYVFIDWFIDWVIYSAIHLLIYLVIHWFSHLFIYVFIDRCI
jgi:hypothetical protein